MIEVEANGEEWMRVSARLCMAARQRHVAALIKVKEERRGEVQTNLGGAAYTSPPAAGAVPLFLLEAAFV